MGRLSYKLTDHDVKLIRELYGERMGRGNNSKGLTCGQIAEKFEVSRDMVNRIISGTRRKDVI